MQLLSGQWKTRVKAASSAQSIKRARPYSMYTLVNSSYN